MSLFMSHPECGGKEGEEGTDCRAQVSSAAPLAGFSIDLELLK